MRKQFSIRETIYRDGKRKIFRASLDVRLEPKDHAVTDYDTGKEIDGKDALVLSVCGSVKFDGSEYAGQCVDDIQRVLAECGLRSEVVDRIVPLWKRWHLNDLTPGSYRQEQIVRQARAEGWPADYDTACAILRDHGCYADDQLIVDGKPYEYGHKWLFRRLPNEVVNEVNYILDRPDRLVCKAA